MPAPAANKGTEAKRQGSATQNGPATRSGTRRTGEALTVPAELEDIPDEAKGRDFLEKHLLLNPPGEPITLAAIATCLHQVARVPGIGRTAAAAVTSVALLVEELEELSINECIKSAATVELNELANDIRELITDAKEQITAHAKHVTSSAIPPRDAFLPRSPTYAETLVAPPPHADPRLAAREGIKARQFVLEGMDTLERIAQLSNVQLKEELNSVLGRIGQSSFRIRTATLLRRRGVLIEVDTDSAARWMTINTNMRTFCKAIGSSVMHRPRTFNVMAFNAPLTFDPNSQVHLGEVQETNNIDEGGIVSARWAKPPEKRREGQKTGHLILSFTNADQANRVISDGLTICNRRTTVQKTRREPTRCFKCQGWNHQASECVRNDRCANCAEDHRTNQCPLPQHRKCASCGSDRHASWSRDCPIFIKKLEECNRRNPESALQFFPTKEAWTWTPQIFTQTSRGWPDGRGPPSEELGPGPEPDRAYNRQASHEQSPNNTSDIYE